MQGRNTDESAVRELALKLHRHREWRREILSSRVVSLATYNRVNHEIDNLRSELKGYGYVYSD